MATLSRVQAMVILGVFSLLALSGCATAPSYGKDDFRVVGEALNKGDKAFTIEAIQVPGLGAAGATLDKMIPAMARIAEAGGNTVCFDLAGFNADGTALDPACVETVTTYAVRAKDQRMGVLVRVLGDATDPKFRRNAVKTAAAALKSEGRAVYWIDGPDAAELAEIFKKKAPGRVVAAPENGDLETVETLPTAPPARPMLAVNILPPKELGAVCFVLAGKDADYAALDAAQTDPIELTPWTPDNSVLSEQERNEGFIALFDGKTMNGWWTRGENKNCFHVSPEGYLEWLSTGGEAIVTRDRYDNFILRIEYKILPNGNSGVWIRAPRDGRASKIGFEVQIEGDSTVEKPDKSNTGAIYDVLPPLCMAAKPEGQWNDMEITVNGPKVKVVLNGTVVQDLSFDDHEELKYRLRNGFICLTDHGNYVAYRNIRLKKL